jgi:hypothetical protein
VSFSPAEGLANTRGRLFSLSNVQPIYRRSEAIMLFGSQVMEPDDMRIELLLPVDLHLPCVSEFTACHAHGFGNPGRLE